MVSTSLHLYGCGYNYASSLRWNDGVFMSNRMKTTWMVLASLPTWGWSTVVEGRGGRTLGQAGGGGGEARRIGPVATGGSFCVWSRRTLVCAVAALLIGVMWDCWNWTTVGDETRMAVHIHNGHGYIYDNMPLERPYEYVIVIILAHFEIDHLHLLAVACLQQIVAHATLPGTALTAHACADCARTPSTRKTTTAPAGRCRRRSPCTMLPRMWPPTVKRIHKWYQMIDITWGPGFEGNLT